jgi:hypothetical protein
MPSYSPENLLKYRDEIVAMRAKAQEERDKQILTLSSAALGLTLTFYKEVLQNQIGSNGWLMVSAWACWSTAILAVIISMGLSARAAGLRVKAIDAGLSGSKSTDKVDIDFAKKTLVTAPILVVVNWISLIAFVIAMGSFATMFFLSMHP